MPSTVIRHMRYNPETEVLVITFVSGKVYAYRPVPPDVYARMLQSGSKGEFFNRFIRDQFTYRQLYN
ncbi:KTSC domain-containing protein [Chitinophaga rhizosphaerae]|uniref:KTSC domain-containing protein n=1 Tax=Chitinophaga rhizosphaerae TaxID=1864947 RepID=UPI000F80AABF|nr:KTSC domain-containing protein [Chitinophaga rhizosphaerae]